MTMKSLASLYIQEDLGGQELRRYQTSVLWMILHFSLMICFNIPRTAFENGSRVCKNRPTLNAKKTEYMAFNVNNQGRLTASICVPLKQVKDLNYLGLRIDSKKRDVKERKGSAFRTSTKCKNLDLKSLKGTQNLDIVEAIKTTLLYSCEICTLCPALTKSLDGFYA